MTSLKNNFSNSPFNNCFGIPKINILNDSEKNRITFNENQLSNTFDYDISKYLSANNNFEKKLLCSFCSKFLKENEYFFFAMIVDNSFVINATTKTFFKGIQLLKEMFQIFGANA